MHIRSRATGAISLLTTDSDAYHQRTFEVNFAPKPVSASIALYEIGGGECSLGIRSYEYRDSPSGPNKKKDFTRFEWNWTPSVYNTLMTRVTFGIVIWGGSGSGVWTVDFWS
jgi:hypothetical protein